MLGVRVDTRVAQNGHPYTVFSFPSDSELSAFAAGLHHKAFEMHEAGHCELSLDLSKLSGDGFYDRAIDNSGRGYDYATSCIAFDGSADELLRVLMEYVIASDDFTDLIRKTSLIRALGEDGYERFEREEIRRLETGEVFETWGKGSE